MADGLRILLVILAAGLVFLGLALGAESQEERFLGLQDNEEFGQASAAGNVVPVTALLVATGAAWGAAVLSRRPILRRFPPALELALGVWLLTVLVQSSYPNYNVLHESRYADLSISPIILDESGVPLALVPVVALWAAGLLLAGDGVVRLLRSGDRPALGRLFGGHVARTLLVLPFLLAVAWGSLELLAAVPVEETGNTLALALLPLLSAAALALAVLQVLRTWALAEATIHPRMAPVTRETWRTLGRVEAIITALLILVAIAGTLLPKTDLEAVALGRVLQFTLRSAVQGAGFVLIPLAWQWRHDRRVWTHIQGDLRAEPAIPLVRPLALIATALSVVAAIASGAATLWGESALLPWTLSVLPLGLLAGIALPRVSGAPVLLLAALCLWATGNTVSGQQDAGTLLEFDTNPGVLILWRILGAGLAAWALGRLARATALDMRRSLAIPLALVVGGTMALVGWLDLAFTAWNIPGGSEQDAVAVGSVIRSLPTAVRSALQVFGALMVGAGAVALARLVRPEWFRRVRPGPVPDSRPVPA